MALPILSTGIPTGVGSVFQTQVVQPIAAAGRFVLPVGMFYVYVVGVDVRLQVIDSLGVWNNITAAGVIPGGLLVSDGVSLGLVNNGGGIENITYIQIG
jgi:hypothetical protein